MSSQEPVHIQPVTDESLDPVTILLVFLIIAINQIFLLSLIAILVKKIKLVIRSTAKKYYYFVLFYILSKLSLCIFLQVKIIAGIPNQFEDLEAASIENVFDNSLAFADCSIVELFLISFEHYMALSFSVFGNKRVEKTVRILMQGVQLVTFLTLLIPLLLFNVGSINHQTLTFFTMSLNCLSVIVFIAAFFFMNFKMTGVMMDKRSSEIIKKVYALLLTLLISRLIMSALEIWMQISLQNHTYESWISIIEQNKSKYVVLGLCFISYLIIMILSEGLPLIMSLRESIMSSMLERTTRSRPNSNGESIITSNSIREELLSNLDLMEDDIDNDNRSTRKNIKYLPESYFGLSQIEDADELEVIEKVKICDGSFSMFKAKWVKNQKIYFVRRLSNISNYIVEEILNEIEKYISLNTKVINPMKVLEKTNENEILIIENFLPENLETRMLKLISSTNKEKLELLIKIAKAIKEFHETIGSGHGAISPKNILFDSQSNIYVTGFGMESLRKYLSLTADYTNISFYTAIELFTSPRIKTIAKPSKSADLYSFGMILYEIFSNNFKYRNLSLNEIRVKFVEENNRPKIPENLNEELKSIMRKCWQEKPESRSTINEVIDSLQRLKM